MLNRKKIYIIITLFLLISWQFLNSNKAYAFNIIDSISENTILMNNLDQHQIVIAVDNVVFDCNGHTVFGISRNEGIAIVISGKRNVIVKNCDIQRYSTGILIENSTEIRIQNSRIANVTYGIDLKHSDNNLITGNEFFANLWLDISLAYSSSNILTQNNHLGGYNGILYFYKSNLNLIQQNSMLKPSWFNLVYNFAIYLEGTQNTISNNKIGYQKQEGIILGNNTTDNIIQGNEISHEKFSGITIGTSSATYNTIKENNIYNNGYGITIYDFNNSNLIYHNNIYSNITSNIYANCTSYNCMPSSAELSFNREGNYWGHISPPCFYKFSGLNTPYDSNRVDVVDSYSYCQKDGWLIDVISPDTTIISAIDGNSNAVVNNNFTASISITFILTGTDNIIPVDQLTFECSLDNSIFSNCVSPLTYSNLSFGNHYFQVRAKDVVGNIDQIPAIFSWKILPQEFFSEIKNISTSTWQLKQNSSLISNSIKIVPKDWVIKVIQTKDINGQNIDVDGYRWYKVKDMTDGTIGWMAAQSLTDGTVYLDYESNLQSDLENKASVQLITPEQRKSVILNAVDTYYTSSNTIDSLYGGGGGIDGLNNFQRFIQGSNFLKELILSIGTQESGPNFDNEICSGTKDGGIGIMQITSSNFKGLGSGLENIFHKNDCNLKTGWIDDFSKYYSNAIQGIYANIKDGFRTLQEKYRQKCPQADTIIEEYTFTCQDIEKIITTWGYNGFAKDKTTGFYTGNYLKYIADKLRNLNVYFSGIVYPNTDNFIEKLEVANNNKQIIRLYSPAVFQVIDELGRITGVQNDIIMEDIPNSLYEKDYEGAVIFFSSSLYHYRVIGKNTGTYKFTVDYTKEGILKNFIAENIPIKLGEIHDYFIDWDALDRGERGVSVNIDYDGNGTVDQIIHSDSVLTDIELPQIIATQFNLEYLYNSQIQINFSAIDNVSGLATVSTILNGNLIQNGQIITLNQQGLNTFIVTAVDNDGNVATLTKTFDVIYNFNGFLSPIKIDDSGVYNLGRTLPVKFQLIDVNGNFVSTAMPQLYVAKISDGIVGTDEIPLSVSSSDTGNQFRYDFINNQYIYNLATDTLSTGFWQLKAVLDSGQAFLSTISIK